MIQKLPSTHVGVAILTAAVVASGKDSISHLSAGSEIRNIFLFDCLLSRMKTLFGPIFAQCSVVEAMLGNISFISGKIKDCDCEDGNWKFLLLCPILDGIKSTPTDDGGTRYSHEIHSRYTKWVIVLDDTDEVCFFSLGYMGDTYMGGVDHFIMSRSVASLCLHILCYDHWFISSCQTFIVVVSNYRLQSQLQCVCYWFGSGSLGGETSNWKQNFFLLNI